MVMPEILVPEKWCCCEKETRHHACGVVVSCRCGNVTALPCESSKSAISGLSGTLTVSALTSVLLLWFMEISSQQLLYDAVKCRLRARLSKSSKPGIRRERNGYVICFSKYNLLPLLLCSSAHPHA